MSRHVQKSLFITAIFISTLFSISSSLALEDLKVEKIEIVGIGYPDAGVPSHFINQLIINEQYEVLTKPDSLFLSALYFNSTQQMAVFMAPEFENFFIGEVKNRVEVKAKKIFKSELQTQGYVNLTATLDPKETTYCNLDTSRRKGQCRYFTRSWKDLVLTYTSLKDTRVVTASHYTDLKVEIGGLAPETCCKE